MKTKRPPLLGASEDLSAVRKRWRVWLGLLSLAVGFGLVSLARGSFQKVAAPSSAPVSVSPRSGGEDPGSTCTAASAVELSFNPMPIAEGSAIWFSSAMRVSGLGPDAATIFLKDSVISFTAGGKDYRVAVPDAAITYDPGVTAGTTSFDAAGNRWVTVVPSSVSGRAFVSGVGFPVPAGGLPGDIGGVTWSASFSTDAPGIRAQWQWAAAVYTTFATDYNVLNVRPVDVVKGSGAGEQAMGEGGLAGQPVNLGTFVTGGARGDGSSPTGSFGSAVEVTPCAKAVTALSASPGEGGGDVPTTTTMSDSRGLRIDGILSTSGLAVTKTCPSTITANAGFACTFTVKNLDPDFNVINLSATNTVPFPGGTAAAAPCIQGGNAVTTLGPTGSGTDSCTGTLNETAPACSTSGDTFLTDKVAVTGTDQAFGLPVSSSTTNSPRIPACPNNTTGLGVTKTCPVSAAPGSQFTCTFTVQNLDPAFGVINLAVTNTVPFPGGTAAAVQCTQSGNPVTTLGAKGSATDTCAGSLQETAPPCGTADIFFTDKVAANATDTGNNLPVSGSTTNNVKVSACTPTPTNTPTNTPTPTPTNTPTNTPTSTPTAVPGKVVTIGPSSMEGDLSNIRPGDWISAGYHFSLADNTHPVETVGVTATVTLSVQCSNGTTPAGSPITIPLVAKSYSVAAHNTSWTPAGDQNLPVVFQGAVQASNLCAGIGTGAMRNQIGAFFSGAFSANPKTSPIIIQFHYRDPAAKGFPNTNCSNPLDPNAGKADVCGASWSETVDP